VTLRRTEYWVPFLSALFLGLFVYQGVIRAFGGPGLHLPSLLGNTRLLPLLMLLSSWLHAWYTLGLRNSVVLLALTVLISWAFEQIGVATGWVYGAYHYTEVLGQKAGHVPLLIPISWFMMGYPSLVIGNLITDSRPTGRWFNTKHWLTVSLVGALVMTAWDLAVDPLMSGAPHQAWEWQHPGPYYGVPLHNFAGWIATTWAIHGTYRLYERYRPAHSLGMVTAPVASLPLWTYAAMMVSNIAAGGPPGLSWFTAVAMGTPLLLAFRRLLNPRCL
jgi:uncharacterized membrane protein